MSLQYGDFVRVKPDAEFRAGQDGMVWAPPAADGVVGMVFAYDRYGQPVRSQGFLGANYAPCEGVEAWDIDELDISSVDR